MSELDEFVGESEPESVEPEAQPEPEQQTAEDEGVPATPEPESQEPHEPQMVPLAAKQAEKDRRIRAERELEMLRQQQHSNQPKPDIFDNPEQVLSNLEIKLKAELSEGLARKQYDDYDTVMDHYTEMVQANPAVHAQVMRDPLSAFKAYEMAKSDLEMKEIGNISEYRQKQDARIAELEAQIAALSKNPGAKVPPDLTAARSTGNDSNVDDTESLAEILGR